MKDSKISYNKPINKCDLKWNLLPILLKDIHKKNLSLFSPL